MGKFILRDGQETLDRRVDAIPVMDMRNVKFPVSSSFPSREPINKYWLTSPPLDQNREGACVAFSLTGALLSEKHSTHISQEIILDGNFAREQIYYNAQRIDEFPGGEYPGATPRMGGTSLQAGLRVLKELQLIDGYTWGFSVDDLILGVGYIGPAVIVIPWYQGMYSTVGKSFELKLRGPQVGYHAIVVKAVEVNEKFFVLLNSWGSSFGHRGLCRVSFDTMKYLFSGFHQISFIHTED